MLLAARAVPKAADQRDAAEDGGGEGHQRDAEEAGEEAEVGGDRLLVAGCWLLVAGRRGGLRGGGHVRGC